MVAIQVASEAFRSLLKLQVSLAGADQLCDCAIAYAAAALVQMPEKSQELKFAIQPRWFVYGLDWNRLQKDGWGGIFGWIDRRPVTEEQREETISESSGFFSMDLEQRRKHLTTVIEVEQAKAQWLMSSLSLNDTEDLTSIFHIFFLHILVWDLRSSFTSHPSKKQIQGQRSRVWYLQDASHFS